MMLLLDRPTDEPLLFPDLTWEQFKLMERWLDVPGVRLSFLNDTCVLPTLNIDLLHECLAIENHPLAIKTFKQRLRKR